MAGIIMGKKQNLALLSILLAALWLSGCGGAGKEPEEKGSGGKEELTLMCIGSMNREILEDAVEEFNHTNEFQVEITCEYYGDEEYKAELARRMAVGEEPDIFFSWQYGFLKLYAQRGKVLDLGGYLSQDPFWEGILGQEDFEGVSFQGNVYGIPLTKCITVVYYNKGIFEECQVGIPKDYGEFLDICKKLKRQGVIPLYLGSTPWSAGMLFGELLRGTCGRELMQYGSFEEIPWISPGYLLAAQKLQELWEEGYIPEDFLGTEGKAVSVQDAAMQVAGNWYVPWKDGEYGVFLLPPVLEENAGIATGGGDRSFAIAAKCSHPEAAISFLKLYDSVKYQKRVLYEEGNLPSREMEIDEERLVPLQAECMELLEQAEGFCGYMDVRFGMEFGGLFHESAQAILSGRDCREILEGLERYAQEDGP